MISTTCWKVAGSLEIPKGLFEYSKNPLCVTNAVLYLSYLATGSCQYHLLASQVVETLALPINSESLPILRCSSASIMIQTRYETTSLTYCFTLQKPLASTILSTSRASIHLNNSTSTAICIRYYLSIND